MSVVQPPPDAQPPSPRTIQKSRRRAHAEEGILAQTFREAMVMWDQAKAAGADLQARLQTLENTLRAAWPKGRERDWQTLCSRCDDYGLELSSCPGDATCGRARRHLPHEFGKPCWCPLGKRFKDKPKPSAEDFTAAGKSKMTRAGR